MKVCGFCNLSFNLNHDGGIHLGVCHAKEVVKSGFVSNQAPVQPFQPLQPTSPTDIGPIRVVEAHSEAAWYFQCPICATKINVDNNTEKSSDGLGKT